MIKTKRRKNTIFNKALHRKPKIEQPKSHLKWWVNPGTPEGYVVSVPLEESNKTGASSGAETTYPSGVPEFTHH
jgi:hypothetical protein